MASLAGRTAIVTGATGGIGSAVVDRLAADGARVFGLDLDVPPNTAPAAATVLPCDVADSDAVAAAVDRVVSETGRVDVLVNVAGIHRPAPFVEITDDDFDLVMRVNVRGVFVPSRAVARVMIAAGGGSIVSFASVAAEHCTPNNSAYAASKGAIVSLTRGMAVSLAPWGIRVNAIAPGPVETPMNQAARQDAAYVARMIERVPLGRQGTPRDVAGLVAFLAGDDSAWMTGELLHLDGGISVLR